MNCLLCNKKIDKIITDKIRSGDKRKVFWCDNCELGMLENELKENEIKQYYSDEYRKKHTIKTNSTEESSELFDFYTSFQKDRLELIKPHLTKDCNVLEIGCSSGMFLYHLKDKVKRIQGIDFDLPSAEFARKKCSCNIYTTPIQETPIEKESLDVIICLQTLEHVINPLKFLQDIKPYLKRNGILYIEVPNTYDALAHVYDLPNHFKFYFHDAHLYYFTERSLKILFDRVGYCGDFYYFQDYNIFNHINWINNDAPQSCSQNGLDKINIKCKNGIGEKLNDFFNQVDIKYKKLLKDLKITSNISFIGSIK